MAVHLNYFYYYNELCLEMNETFIKYFDTLNDIIKTINSKLDHEAILADYDTLKQLDSTWIQSIYKVDNDFISWWGFCVQNKYIDYLKNVGKIGDLLCLKNITLDNNLNIKIQNKHNLDDFYKKFLKFDVCSTCYFGLSLNTGYNYTCRYHFSTYDVRCVIQYKEKYFKNLNKAHAIYNRITESYKEVTQELFDNVNKLQKKVDYFDNNHKQDVRHLRTDVESCTFMIDNERKAAKTHREEVDMQINDLNHRICKMELLSGRDNYESNDKAMSIPKQPIVIEDVVVDQAQMIKELREELKKERDDISHLRIDVESCTFMIDNEHNASKTHREDVVAKLEQTVADQAQMIKKFHEDVVAKLEQTVVDQAQMIKELREELKKQRDDFEAYKLQKQRQIAALM